MITYPGRAPGYVVTAACVVACDREGRHVYIYGGAAVPPSIPHKEIARLLAGGFLREPAA